MLRDIWVTIVGIVAVPLRLVLGFVSVLCAIGTVVTFLISFLGKNPWMVIKAVTLPILVVLIVARVLQVVLEHALSKIANLGAS